MSHGERLEKTLRYSLYNGIFASAMNGFMQEYLTPFLLLLGGTAKHVGLLSSLPNISAALVQLESASLSEFLKSRKKTISIFVFLQGAILLLIASSSARGLMTPSSFIALMVLYSCSAAMINPAWGSLMSDLVDTKKRGEIFGWRSKVFGMVTFGVTFFAGYTLYEMKKINAFYGFSLLFACAFLCRMASWFSLRKMHEPPLKYDRKAYFSIFQFLAKLRESNFAKFAVFVALMNFSVNIAAPFFAVLMLKDLKFNYLVYTLVTIPTTLALNLTVTRWGRLADSVGNLRIIRFVSPLIAVIPVLWIMNRSPLFLIAAQIFSGFLWAGFNICTSNFIYDAVTPEKRVRCISYFNVMNGVALSCGALLGAFMLANLPPIFGYRILALFLISSVLRIVVAVSGPMDLKEVRHVEHMSHSQLFFSIVGMRPLLGVERKTVRY